MLKFTEYFKNNLEMRHTILTGVISTLLLESGILIEFLRNVEFKYLLLALILLVSCYLLLLSAIIYDHIIIKHIEYILYTVADNDTIQNICVHFLPQCSIKLTWKLIKEKNNLCENSIHKGQKLLIPVTK